MRNIVIQNTKLYTSRLGLGTSSLHHWPTRRQRQRLLAHAWDHGIRYFDTAPLYGHGLAETELGLFAQGRREELVLATKFGIVPSVLLARFPWLVFPATAARALAARSNMLKPLARKPRHDYSAAYLRERIVQSLQALRTNYLDIMFLHEPSLALMGGAHELVDELSRLKYAGIIRAFGISGTADSISEILLKYPGLLDVIQLEVGDGYGPLSVGTRQVNPQVTFGHFRGMAHDLAAAPGRRDAVFRDRVAAAIRINPDGVILFSSRKVAHLDEMVIAHEALEDEA